jgi:hypothetical protein
MENNSATDTEKVVIGNRIYEFDREKIKGFLKLPDHQYITTGYNDCKCNEFEGDDFNKMYCKKCGQKYSFEITVKPVWIKQEIKIKEF